MILTTNHLKIISSHHEVGLFLLVWLLILGMRQYGKLGLHPSSTVARVVKGVRYSRGCISREIEINIPMDYCLVCMVLKTFQCFPTKLGKLTSWNNLMSSSGETHQLKQLDVILWGHVRATICFWKSRVQRNGLSTTERPGTFCHPWICWNSVAIKQKVVSAYFRWMSCGNLRTCSISSPWFK